VSHLLQEQALAMLSAGAYSARVVDVNDPSHLNRVQIRVYNVDGASNQDAAVWARVAVPFAGNNRGAFLIPDIGDEVLVIYLSGDSRFPVVIGSMWNGHDTAPESIGDNVDRWTITGKAGTKIAIIEDSSGPTIHFTTPGNLSGKMTDSGGGSIEFTDALQNSVKLDTSGITVSAPTASVQITAASGVTVTAPQVTVNAAMATFSGIVQCQVMQATTVVATTYTPGAGNVW
jgi:phage baseplate assembly protein gpV